MNTKDSFTQALKSDLTSMYPSFRAISGVLQTAQKITIPFIAVIFLPAWFCLPAFSLRLWI
jgi:hypothetical protein